MTIKFFCPNGHKLSARADRSGTPGKCPECGTAFLVPELEEEEVADQEHAAGVQIAGMIKFLCPNGHELNGPASLQGKPGQCPHCSEKFIIPDYDEEEEEYAEEEPMQEIESFQPLVESLDPLDTEELEEIQPIDEFAEIEPQEIVSLPDTNGEHTLATIFTQLWQNRSGNEVVKLHLRDGETLEPSFFSENFPQADYGLFAVKEGNDRFTLSAVMWDAVLRVSVSKAKELPPEMFD